MRSPSGWALAPTVTGTTGARRDRRAGNRGSVMRTRVVTCLALVTGLLVGVAVPASAATVTPERVSVATDGAQANKDVY